jgi:hypothetical protein
MFCLLLHNLGIKSALMIAAEFTLDCARVTKDLEALIYEVAQTTPKIFDALKDFT